MKRTWLLIGLALAGVLGFIWWQSRRTDPAALADAKRKLADKAGQQVENLNNSARDRLADPVAVARGLYDLVWGDSKILGTASGAGAPPQTGSWQSTGNLFN